MMRSAVSPFILASLDKALAGQPADSPVHLLDLACGTGRHITAVLDKGYQADLQITAADINADSLDQLMAGLPTGAPVRPVCIDLEQDGLALAAELAGRLGQHRFDLVVVTNYLHRPLLAQIFDLVSPDGQLLYETFGQGNEAFGKPSRPAFLLAKGELAAALPPEFSVQHSFFGQRQELYPEQSPAIISQLAARRNS